MERVHQQEPVAATVYVVPRGSAPASRDGAVQDVPNQSVLKAVERANAWHQRHVSVKKASSEPLVPHPLASISMVWLLVLEGVLATVLINVRVTRDGVDLGARFLFVVRL
jgi:hypothetical protein